MANKQVRFNGQIHSFPSDFTDEEISQSLSAHSPESSEKQQSALSKAYQYAKEDTSAFTKNLGTGYLKLSRGLANTPHNVANLFGYGDKVGELAPEDFNYAEALGLPKDQENRAVQAIPEIAAAFAMPSSTIPRMIASQAAFGATQNKNPLIGAAEGAGGALAGTAIGKALGYGFNKLRPSNLFRGELSPEQLAHNLKNAEGTQTPLGSVLQNPWLQRLHENVLPNIVGSGAEKTMQKTAKQVAQKGEDILHNLRGSEEVHENYGDQLKQALKESAEKVTQEKNSRFAKVNQMAEEAGVTTNRSNLRKEAEAILAQVKADPDLAQFTNTADIKLLEEIVNPGKKKIGDELQSRTRSIKQVKEEPNYKGQLNLGTGKPLESISSEKNVSLRTPSPHASGSISVITGKPTQEPHKYSLRNTDILRGKIGEHAYEANVKGEKPKAAIYARLKKALEQDVGEAIETSSHPELKNAHKEAMDFYKKDYAPFKDKDITKFIKEGGDPDTLLNHFLRIGKNDRVQLLQKLSQSIGKETNLIGNAYLAPAYENGELNPLKLNTLYHKLGKRQRVEIFGKENNEKLKNYTDLVHKNKEAFSLMFNPKTGARLGHLGTLAGTAAGHIPAAIGIGALGNAANRLLTNESFRDKLIKAMIKNKPVKFPNMVKGLQKTGAASQSIE